MTQDNVAQVIRFVGRCRPRAAATIPSRSTRRSAVATAMPWRADAQGRILVIGDAPARPSGQRRALELAERFQALGADPACRARSRRSSPAHAPAAQLFFEQIARAGGGDFSAYQGQIIENVLLSVLRDPGERPRDDVASSAADRCSRAAGC